MGTPELPIPGGLALRPFRGVRFAVEDPAKVTSPPYDLISDADVEVLLDSHPNNVVRLILPCPPSADSSNTTNAAASQPSPGRYADARETLRAWLESGVLVADAQPALYVYEQSGPGVLQRGLIGDVALADPAQRVILPHEDVMPGPIADRLALMSTTQANLEPIFLLYDGSGGTATGLVDEVATTRRPLVTAHTEDGLTHRLWAITDESEIAAVNADLHPPTGPHRRRPPPVRDVPRTPAAGTRNPRGARRRPLGLRPRPAGGLRRVPARPQGHPPRHPRTPPLAEATAKAKGAWRVQDYETLSDGLAALQEAAEPAFLLADAHSAHLLTNPDPVQLARAMPADHSDRWNTLNTSILTEFILPLVWGMHDSDQDVRIVHHDAQAATDLATRTGGTAVLLNPLAVEDVLTVAAAGERVPPQIHLLRPQTPHRPAPPHLRHRLTTTRGAGHAGAEICGRRLAWYGYWGRQSAKGMKRGFAENCEAPTHLLRPCSPLSRAPLEQLIEFAVEQTHTDTEIVELLLELGLAGRVVVPHMPAEPGDLHVEGLQLVGHFLRELDNDRSAGITRCRDLVRTSGRRGLQHLEALLEDGDLYLYVHPTYPVAIVPWPGRTAGPANCGLW
ncbi:hypothetical protein GCM10020001_009020 [Nonomuraea salmonea]